MQSRPRDRELILAGDIGATKTHLGIFTDRSPSPVATATYHRRVRRPGRADRVVSREVAMRPARASFGVAGVVRGRRVPRINLPWEVDAVVLEGQVGLREVILVNDVEANARGILALGDDDFSVLHPGAADAKGTRAVVAAGAGLGEAALWWDGTRHHPAASEGGSAAFGPSSQLEVELHRFLARERGRVNWGHVCSGPGLRNIYRFLAGGGEAPAPAAMAAAAAQRSWIHRSRRRRPLHLGLRRPRRRCGALLRGDRRRLPGRRHRAEAASPAYERLSHALRENREGESATER